MEFVLVLCGTFKQLLLYTSYGISVALICTVLCVLGRKFRKARVATFGFFLIWTLHFDFGKKVSL